MHDETSPRYAGWRVVLACFLLAVSIFGFALYGQGVYLVELQRLNGWPASLISGASTLSLLIGNVIVIFTDEIVRRLGLKRLALAGIACLAISMVLLALVSVPCALYAAFALMSLGWVVNITWDGGPTATSKASLVAPVSPSLVASSV